MMTREEAIALLNEQYETCKRIYDCSADQRKSYPNVPQFMEALGMALTALSTLQEENAQLRGELEYEQEHANAYYEECGQWEAENEKLRDELESVRAERNAAVEDVAAIIGDVEEIRRGYGVDNEDADSAFARLCETYCANNGRLCYAECEKYHCKNFKWRGPKKED